MADSEKVEGNTLSPVTVATWLIALSAAIAAIIINFTPLFDTFSERAWGDRQSAITTLTIFLLVLVFFFGSVLLGHVFHRIGLYEAVFTSRRAVFEGIVARLDAFSTDDLSRVRQLLESSLTAAYRDKLLWKPVQYTRLIRNASQEGGARFNQINLVGTMVGFSFTISQALGRHIARIGESFNAINIFAPDLISQEDGGRQYSALYALYFVGRTVRTALFEMANGQGPGKLNFEVDTYYIDVDIFSAALHLPGRECVVLQAMDSDTLEKVFLENGELFGVRYPQQGALEAVYRRYTSIIGGYSQDARWQQRCERWSVSAQRGGAVSITVDHPRWTASHQSGAWDFNFVKDPKRYGDREGSSPQLFNFDKVDDAVRFLDGFMERLIVADGTGSDIRRLDEAYDVLLQQLPDNQSPSDAFRA